jgi:hypothetical protein
VLLSQVRSADSIATGRGKYESWTPPLQQKKTPAYFLVLTGGWCKD